MAWTPDTPALWRSHKRGPTALWWTFKPHPVSRLSLNEHQVRRSTDVSEVSPAANHVHVWSTKTDGAQSSVGRAVPILLLFSLLSSFVLMVQCRTTEEPREYVCMHLVSLLSLSCSGSWFTAIEQFINSHETAETEEKKSTFSNTSFVWGA